MEEFESQVTCNNCALLYPKGSVHHCFTSLWIKIKNLEEKVEELSKP